MPTGIEWTDETWNPMTGCTKISAGCDHCYAFTIAHAKTRDAYLRRLPVVDTTAKGPQEVVALIAGGVAE